MAESQTIHEAILKLRADSAQLRQDLQRGSSVLESGLQGMRTLALSLAPALTLGGVAAFAKGVVDAAGRLQDLEDQTGVSAQLLSGMNTIFEETGTSAEAFAKGVFTAQRNLGQIRSESDPAAVAIKSLGLNLDELRNAHPDRFIEMIAEALSKIENPTQRAAAGSIILGRAYRELAPALDQAAGRFAELKAQGMSPEDIKRLDEFGDALTRIGNRMQILAAGPLAAFIEGFERFFGLTERGNLTNALVAIDAEIDRIEKMLQRREDLRKKGFGFFTAADDDEQKRLLQSLREQQRVIDQQLNRLNAPSRPAKGTGTFTGLPDPEAAKRAAQKDAEREKQLRAEALRDMLAGIDEQQRREEQAGQTLLAVLADIEAQGLTPIEASLAEINKRYDDMIVKILAVAEATGQNLDHVIEQIDFFRRQRQLLAQTPTTGADAVDADQGDAIREQVRESKDLGQTLSDLNQRQHQARQMALALGNAYDLTSANISIQRQRVEELVRAYGALSPEVQAAVVELKKIEQQQARQNLFHTLTDSLERGITDTIRGINEGNQTLGEGMGNLARNMLLSFQEELLKLAVLNPIKNALMDMFNIPGQRAQTFGSIFGSQAPAAGPNIQNFPNVAAAAPLPFPIDVEEWTFEAVQGFENLGTSVQTGLGDLFDISSAGFSEFFSALADVVGQGLSALSSMGGDSGFDFSSIFSGLSSYFGGSYDDGGVVPGPRGAPRLVLAHGQEMFIPTHKPYMPSMRSLPGVAGLNSDAGGAMPGGRVIVDFQNATIIPAAPWVTAKDIPKVIYQDLRDDGLTKRSIEEYVTRK